MLHLMIVNINNYVYGYELSMTINNFCLLDGRNFIFLIKTLTNSLFYAFIFLFLLILYLWSDSRLRVGNISVQWWQRKERPGTCTSAWLRSLCLRVNVLLHSLHFQTPFSSINRSSTPFSFSWEIFDFAALDLTYRVHVGFWRNWIVYLNLNYSS